MTSSPLLDATLRQLADHRSTRALARSLAHPDYDRAFGERICRLADELCTARGYPYPRAVGDFVTACDEFLRHQHQLERTGRYTCPSHDDARRNIYSNERLMATTYLHALLLSQALWVNHARLFRFYRERFCSGLPATGSVLDVPVGTGLFIAELVRMNPNWNAHGVDLSSAAIDFAAAVCRLAGVTSVALRVADVFELPLEHRFDRIICGELLEHVDNPEELLRVLVGLLRDDGRVFLTTAIWAAHPDHVYLFESAAEVRAMLARHFVVEAECVLPLEPDCSPEDAQIPINYACVLRSNAR